MAEIKKDLIKMLATNGAKIPEEILGVEVDVITPEHSISDVIRYCMEQSSVDEVVYIANNIKKEFEYPWDDALKEQSDIKNKQDLLEVNNSSKQVKLNGVIINNCKHINYGNLTPDSINEVVIVLSLPDVEIKNG